jgi:dynein heavy chain
MCKPGVIREAEQIAKLWIHEASRVFHDRLVDNEDREWFGRVIEDLLGRQFRIKWTYEEIFKENKIYFSDLLKIDSGTRDYEEVKEIKKISKLLENKLFDYNMDNNNRKMNLVFFDDCMEHIMRLSRVLRQPRGNAMLIGVGGSGKQSLTRLSTFILEYDLF